MTARVIVAAHIIAATIPAIIVDGEMECALSETLYRGLQSEGLLYDTADAAAYSIQLFNCRILLRGEGWFQALSPELLNRYSLNISMNYMKFSLAAESFHRPVDPNAISAAAAFVLAGCLLDHMIDEGSAWERRLALEKLKWDYCAYYFVDFGAPKSTHIVDILYSSIGGFLRERHGSDLEAYRELLKYLKRAVSAESQTSQALRQFTDKTVTRDKSVLFVVIGFLLALYGNHTPEELSAFFLLGDIFRSVDDLCDLSEDVRAGRVNSILDERGGLNADGIAQEFAWLHDALQRLSDMVSGSFYQFIRYELQTWTLSNPYLYQKAIGAL